MAIVYYDTKNPRFKYAYRSTSKWDPIKKRVRPEREYLGRYDVETQQIIPTSKVRGGVRGDTPPATGNDAFVSIAEYQSCLDKLEKANKRIEELESYVSELTKKARATSHVISGIRKQLEELEAG